MTSMRVLLVENEIRSGENISEALGNGPGFDVDHVRDGEAALELAGTQRYNLIILDLNLPKLDGRGVVQRLRKLGDKIPILMLGPSSEPQTIVSLFDAGADDYLSKPFDLGELIARAKVQVRRRHPLASTEPTTG